MRSWFLGTLALLTGLAPASPSAAQELRAVFETAFTLESRLLAGASERYLEAREREAKAMRLLNEHGVKLDQALADPSITVAELRELESQLLTQRESALARSQESAELRKELYRSMDRLAELGKTLERERDRSLVLTDRLSGLWRFSATGNDEFGVLNLRLDGATVSGVYRMSNGNRGSLHGTLINNVLKLERIDTKSGSDMTLEGTFDPNRGEIEGSWLRRELTAGTTSLGSFSARKLSPQEEEEALELGP